MSRTLAIGDIHGCLRSLEEMEGYVGFTPEDQIILLGDYVDKGLNTCGVIDWLIDRSETLSPIMLLGNHEIMMLAAQQSYGSLQTWKNCGGDTTLMSYSAEFEEATLDAIPDRHWAFLKTALLPSYETSTHLFVHACVLPHLPLEEQPDDVIYWQPFDEWFVPHHSGKQLICGHKSQKNGLPFVRPGGICIDTWAHGEGWLTCLDVNTGTYWQTNERRERRKDTIVNTE